MDQVCTGLQEALDWLLGIQRSDGLRSPSTGTAEVLEDSLGSGGAVRTGF